MVSVTFKPIVTDSQARKYYNQIVKSAKQVRKSAINEIKAEIQGRKVSENFIERTIGSLKEAVEVIFSKITRRKSSGYTYSKVSDHEGLLPFESDDQLKKALQKLKNEKEPLQIYKTVNEINSLTNGLPVLENFINKYKNADHVGDAADLSNLKKVEKTRRKLSKIDDLKIQINDLEKNTKVASQLAAKILSFESTDKTSKKINLDIGKFEVKQKNYKISINPLGVNLGAAIRDEAAKVSKNIPAQIKNIKEVLSSKDLSKIADIKKQARKMFRWNRRIRACKWLLKSDNHILPLSVRTFLAFCVYQLR